LNKIAILHLFTLGYNDDDLVNFKIEMGSPSTVAAQQRLELWRMRLEVAGMAQEGVFDRGFVMRKIFNLNDKQIASIKDGKRIDKLEDLLLASMEAAPPPPPGEEAPPEEPPAPGAEELPQTLGGQEGGEAPAPEIQQIASFKRDGKVLHETERKVFKKKNMGSTGNDASISVDFGKDLFSTGENPLKLTFGTEKQTASDPNDFASWSRMITRPFSEDDASVEMPGEDQIDEVEQMLQAVSEMINNRRS
jgi:hypothetical protein